MSDHRRDSEMCIRDSIETGLDISNVNTMIIHDADKLGLSQLYQLRGRVGRSNRTSYAFLLSLIHILFCRYSLPLLCHTGRLIQDDQTILFREIIQK